MALRGSLDSAHVFGMDVKDQDMSSHSPQWQHADVNDSATSSSQHTTLQSVANSQESNYSSSSDRAITSPASDDGSATDNHAGHAAKLGESATRADSYHDASNHLLHLSTIAAAQDRIKLDPAETRRRMADGEARGDLTGSMGPARGHARNASTVSVASTTGSTIGELSAELKTRLSYAMVKVNLGLQTRSIEEVECLAPQAVSPATGTPTLHRRQGSGAVAVTAASAQVHFAQDAVVQRRKSDTSSITALSSKPTLAPPATIQPSTASPPRPHPRRNSTPRVPALLHSQSDPPHTPAYSTAPTLSQGAPMLFPQTRNAREQDAVETLLFMSSPNNSANLKHAFSPSASPDPSQASAKSAGARHAFPAGTRKGLPSHRPPIGHKRFDKASGMLHPDSPMMDLDSPQHSYYSSNRVTPRRRVRGNSTHLRNALTLPAGLGGGHATRRVLRDEDIERMLDRVAAETADSSDDDEIQIPRLKNVMGVRR